MPKGKYPRQSAAVKAAIAKIAPVTATAVAAPIPPAISPAISQSIDPALMDDAVQVVTQAAKVADVAISHARRPHRFADHAKSRDIDSLTHDELRAYGLEIGMTRRDCAELSLDRLRAGCRAHLTRHFDALTE